MYVAHYLLSESEYQIIMKVINRYIVSTVIKYIVVPDHVW